MDRQYSLPALVEAADEAYQLVRLEVIDALPLCTPIDPATLSWHQQRALTALHHAEDELARYREQAYAAG
jgi:hypothetical protein